MLGNDLVWLADPFNQGRGADRRLLDRILTPEERLLVRASDNPDRLLWSLWAAKEAAYKAWSQEHAGSFLPARFALEFNPEPDGPRVTHDGWSIPVSWTYGPDWVHALAGKGTVTVAPIGADASAAVRALAVRVLQEAGGPEALVSGRPPRFVSGGRDLGVELSLSHDGPYGAVAFQAPLSN